VSVVNTAGPEAGVDEAPTSPPTPPGPADPRIVGFLRNRTVGLVIAALSAVGLTIGILPPPMYADAYNVWRAASVWPHLAGRFAPGDLQHAMRLGTVLPTWVAQQIFGHGQTAFVVAAAFLLTLFAVGAFALGRALFSAWIGYATLGILLIHPFFTVVDSYTRAYSTGTGSLVPDAPSAGLFALGVAAVAVASRRSGRPQTRWLLGAGLCWGLAYLTREYVAFMYLAIPVVFWALRVPLRRMVWPAVPMLACLAFELVHNALVWGDPFARLTVAGEHGRQLADPVSKSFALTTFLRAVGTERLGYGFAIAVPVVIIGAVAFRDRRLWMIVAWFFSLWIPLTLLGGLINPGDPSIRAQLVRYWYLVFIPLVAGALATVQMTVKRITATTGTRLIATVAVAAVLAGLYVAPALRQLPMVHRDADWRDLRAWLKAHQGVHLIWTDERAAQTLTFYAREPDGRVIWPGEIKSFPRQASHIPPQDAPDVYLRSKYAAREKPSPANGWKLLWLSRNHTLQLWQKS
jgi:hypothetical protein